MRKQNLTTVINILWTVKPNKVYYRLETSKSEWADKKWLVEQYEKTYGDCIAYCCYIDYSKLPWMYTLNPDTTLPERIKEIAKNQGVKGEIREA